MWSVFVFHRIPFFCDGISHINVGCDSVIDSMKDAYIKPGPRNESLQDI